MANVLIVDDERSIRTTLAEFIREDGHAVRTAESAVEALRAVDAESVDILVTDIILPGMSGVDLLRRVHATYPDTQVIVITGEPTVDTAAEAVRQGAFDYLAKPISGEEIRATVLRAVRVRSLIDERRRLEEENQRHREHLEEAIARATGELRASETRYRAVVESASEAIFVAQNGVLPFANAATTVISGLSGQELASRPFEELVHPDDRAFVRDQYARLLRGERVPDEAELRMVRSDGEMRWISVRSKRVDWGGQPASLNLAVDVTEQRLADERERQRRDRVQAADRALVKLAMQPRLVTGDLDDVLREIAETVADTIAVERVEVWLTEGEGHALYGDAPSRCAELFERTPRRHSRGRPASLTIHPKYTEALRSERSIVAADARSDPRTAEFSESHFIPLGIGALIDVAVRLEGQVIGLLSVEHVGPPRAWHDEEVHFMTAVAGLITVAVEAARRRWTEEALAQSEMAYRGLFEDSPASVIVEDFSGVKRQLDGLRDQGVEDLDAYVDQFPEFIDECIRSIRVVDVNEAAVRLHRAASKADLIDRIGDDFDPAARDGFRGRLRSIWRGERVFETTTVDSTLDGERLYTAVRWSIPPGREAALDRVLLAKTDITSVVETEQRLRRALDGTIEAIGRATETRDPYTAGHQRRVTELAVPIAQLLELDATRVAATRAAGLLHDIGKLSIPAEILTKPSALSTMEMALMRVHPQSAFEILKTVDFPWPLADIVLQHHERLDGSGYPLALRGDDILLEARILAVADVVEAMASHRPYRPALGVAVALAEIERGRGTLYDAAVVDACLRLFRERGFAFSSDSTV